MRQSHIGRIAFYVVLVCGVSSTACATSIVFLLNPGNLVVGADSKTYDFDGRSKPGACKLVAANGFVFANAGPLEDEAGPFRSLAVKVLQDAKNLTDAMTRFDAAIQPRLVSLAAQIFSAKPDYYLNSLEGKPWFQVALAGVGPNGAQILVRTYKPFRSGAHIGMRVYPSDCLKGCAGIHVGLGFFDSIDRAFLHPETIPVVSISGTIRYLIGLEVAAHPDRVAAPIAILTIDAAGAHWIEPGYCK